MQKSNIEREDGRLEKVYQCLTSVSNVRERVMLQRYVSIVWARAKSKQWSKCGRASLIWPLSVLKSVSARSENRTKRTTKIKN